MCVCNIYIYFVAPGSLFFCICDIGQSMTDASETYQQIILLSPYSHYVHLCTPYSHYVHLCKTFIQPDE